MTSAPALHTTEIGDAGERVVLLHGLFGQGRNFTQVAKALQPELRSTLVDLPNHGRSAWTGSVDYVDVADAVATWLRKSGRGRLDITLPGGTLNIDWGGEGEVYLEGPAEEVFSGEWI